MEYIRRASSLTDRYGQIVYRIDGQYIREANSSTDRYGQIRFYIP